MRRGAGRLLAAGALGLALAASGCTADEDAPSSSPSGTPSASADDTSAPPASADPSASVTPASGPRLGVDTVRLRLFDDPGWSRTRVGTTVLAGVRGEAGRLDVSVSDIGTINGDLDQNADATLQVASREDPPVARVADRVVDGVTCYVLEGRDDEVHRYLVGGVLPDAWRKGGVVTNAAFQVAFTIPADWPGGDDLVEQMIASIRIGDAPAG